MKALMKEFEETVEAFRKDVHKCNRNLVACRRARVALQHLRLDLGPRIRTALLNERDKVEALRHGVTVREWKRRRKEKENG